jgi:GTP cyclohydrolase II
MQLTVFGTRASSGDEREEVVALRTLPPDVAAQSPATPDARSAPLVRVHSACFTGDVLGSDKCDCGSQLMAALVEIQESGDGALLYLLNQEGRGIGLTNKIRAYALQTTGHDTITANLALGLPVEQRDFTVAAECLLMLGMRRIRLLTNNPLKLDSLRDCGIDVCARVPLGGIRTEENEEYLATKDHAMGHLGALDLARWSEAPIDRPGESVSPRS